MRLETGYQKWFQKVFNDNYDYILNYLFYLSGDNQLTEDLVQDVFLQLWEKREKINNKTIRPYLYKIARNAFLKSVRKENVDLKFRSNWIEQVENNSPEYIMELKEFDLKLQKTISGLPERCRVIFLMSRMEKLKYAEIAEHLQLSVKAVEKQMSKALAVLQKELGVKI